MTLGEGFPECTRFGTRGRPLPREPLPRLAFPKCCTWGSLPRVFWGLPRVLLTLGEGGFSRSVPLLPLSRGKVDICKKCIYLLVIYSLRIEIFITIDFFKKLWSFVLFKKLLQTCKRISQN
jgi:hypothetical protein